MSRSVSTGTLDLCVRGTREVVEGFDFPKAKPTAIGLAAQASGAVPQESHYDLAGFTLPILFTATTSELVQDDIEATEAALRSNMTVTASYGPASKTARLKDITLESVVWDEAGLSATATWSGAYYAATIGRNHTIPITIADGIGTQAITDIGGNLAADTDLTLVTGALTDLIACGIKVAPAADYDPTDTYAGTPVTMTAANTDYSLGSAPARDINANRGSHYVIAKVATNATTPAHTGVGVETTNAGVTAPRSKVPAVASGNLLLGKVKIPVAEVPGGGSEAVWGSPAAGYSYTAGTIEAYVPVASFGTVGQFTIASRKAVSIELERPTADSSALIVQFQNTADSSIAQVSLLAGGSSGWNYLPSGVAVLPAGTYNIGIRCPSNATQRVHLAGSGSPPPANLKIYMRDVITFDASNTVRARCSDAGKTATLSALTRIPSGSALIVPATFAAGAGIRYSAGGVYPFNGTSVTGAALVADRGDSEFAVPPGDSMLVVHAGGGANATGVLSVTERHLGLS
jgi:hypothetical protein